MRKTKKSVRVISKSNKKFGAWTIILIALLVLRIIAQFANAYLLASEWPFLVSFLFFGILYIVALVGICKKQKWGSVLAMVIALIDIIGSASLGGTGAIGAIIGDLVILALGHHEYKHL